MPENKPRNIFEAINDNVIVVNKNVLAVLNKMEEIEKKQQENQQELIALKMMFQAPAPEQPNARGEEGANEVSSEQ